MNITIDYKNIVSVERSSFKCVHMTLYYLLSDEYVIQNGKMS